MSKSFYHVKIAYDYCSFATEFSKLKSIKNRFEKENIKTEITNLSNITHTQNPFSIEKLELLYDFFKNISPYPSYHDYEYMFLKEV
jgi:hypothetical protein